MKKLLGIILIVAVGVFALLLAKDSIIKTSVEKGVEAVTGLKLNIGSLKVGILKPVADIKNLVLSNPAGYPDKTMIDMPEIYVNYDLGAIMAGTTHLPEVRLALKEFVVVKNAKGELNLDALKNVQAQKQGKAPAQKEPAGKVPQIKIDLLKLSIGKVIYKDYSKGATPQIQEFNINLNETYSNIDDPSKLVSLIVVKALIHTSISTLANFDLKGLEGTVGGVLSNAQKAAATAVTTAQETTKQATGAVKEVSGNVKDMLKNPFGSGK